jgi:hypothetical protein
MPRLLILLMLLLPGLLPAQEIPSQGSMTLGAFVQAMRNCKDSVFVLRQVRITPDPVRDQYYLQDVRNVHNSWNPAFQSADTVSIRAKVQLDRVQFAESCVLPMLHFQQLVQLEKVEISGDLFFRACVFAQGIRCSELKAEQLGFEHCQFFQGFWAERIVGVIPFTNNRVDGNFQISNTDAPLNIQIRHSDFNIQTLEMASQKGGEVVFENTFVSGIDSTAFIHLGGSGYFDYLTMERDTFLCTLLITDCSVKERLNIFKCRFAEKVAMQGLDVPEKNTDARWYQFDQSHLAIATEGITVFSSSTALSTDSEDDFYSLIKVYYQLLRAYKYTGDEESYDACFIEMKDLITRKSRWNWNQGHKMNDFAEWQLNRFLRLFCDYGVNPGKALVMSLFFIALFGLIYLLFPLEPLPFNWSDLFIGLFGRRLSFIQRVYLLGIVLRCWFSACGYSMNAFVTLGYGHGRGFARYIAVAEGLLGWFMFSVFSASLIGQILSQG